MKKLVLLIITILSLLCVSACGKKDDIETAETTKELTDAEIEALKNLEAAKQKLYEDSVNKSKFEYNSNMFQLWKIISDSSETISDIYYFTRANMDKNDSLITTHDFNAVIQLFQLAYEDFIAIYDDAYLEVNETDKEVAIKLDILKANMDEMNKALEEKMIGIEGDTVYYNLDYDLPQILSDSKNDFLRSCHKY